jgi:hypothetical protein
LLREVEERTGILMRLAQQFTDYREPALPAMEVRSTRRVVPGRRRRGRMVGVAKGPQVP